MLNIPDLLSSTDSPRLAIAPDLHQLHASLAAIVGEDQLRVESGRLIADPADSSEVAGLLRYADAHGVAVAPRGAGTKRDWGYPDHSVLQVSTSRLNRLREHTWQDMTCTVEAGCVWSDMQSQLAKHGQFVALDPLWPERATVGGVIATNDSGSLRHRFGGLRDLVIGMTLVLADGTEARTGGKVVKNVAGYDLHKLMIGAYGTLAFITEVTFRLHSVPRHSRSVSIAHGSAAPLCELMLKLLDSQLSLQAVQLASAELDGSPAFRLDVQLASLPEVVESQVELIAAHAARRDLTLMPAEDSVWSLRQQLLAPCGTSVVKATMLPTAIESFATAIKALGGASVTQAAGIACASVPASSATGLLQLRQRLEAQQGSLLILRQPAALDPQLDPWGALPDSLPLMRELKRQFDPNRTLNPGRFLGGI